MSDSRLPPIQLEEPKNKPLDSDMQRVLVWLRRWADGIARRITKLEKGMQVKSIQRFEIDLDPGTFSVPVTALPIGTNYIIQPEGVICNATAAADASNYSVNYSFSVTTFTATRLGSAGSVNVKVALIEYE